VLSIRSGFSLIELLVVVAIIGVLAGAGIVGYTLYIDGVKADSAQNQFDEFAKAVDTDVFAATSGLSGQGALLPGGAQTCEQAAVAAVKAINKNFDSDLDAPEAALYGNILLTSSLVSVGTAATQTFSDFDGDGNILSFGLQKVTSPNYSRGVTVFFCMDPTADLADTSISQCICTDSDLSECQFDQIDRTVASMADSDDFPDALNELLADPGMCVIPNNEFSRPANVCASTLSGVAGYCDPS